MKLSHLSLAIFAAISLAACGGSNNNSHVTPESHGHGLDNHGHGSADQGNGSGNQGNGTGNQGNGSADQGNGSADQGNGSNTDNSALDSDVKVKFNDDYIKTVVTPPANVTINKETSEVAAPKGTLATKVTNEVDYIKNPGLYDKDGNLPTTYADNGAADATGKESSKVFYKAGDKFVAAYYATDADGTIKFYKEDDSGTKADKKAPLTDSDLFVHAQVATGQKWTNVKGFEVFGKTVARPEKVVTPTDAIDRSGLKIGELTTSDIKATLEFKELKQGLNSGKTDLETASNADNKNTVISSTDSVKLGSVMAYNLPHSLTTLTTDSDGVLVTTPYFMQDATADNAVNTFGLKTASLPENVKATYTGKVFTVDSKADLSLDVQFSKRDAGYVKNVKIENRTNADGETLSAYVGNEAVVIGDTANTNAFEVGLTPVEKGVTAEYDKLTGNFYGPKAEEVAGTVKDNNTVKGAFAAQRGNLTEIK